MQDTPRLPRKSRKEDDPKVIGLWKIGRTIGKGSSGKSSVPVAVDLVDLPSVAAKARRHDRSGADCPPL